MRLLSPDLAAPVISPLLGKRIGYVQTEHGNPGDGIIHQATLGLFRLYGVDYKIVNEPRWCGRAVSPDEISHSFGGCDEMVLFAGGSIGYPRSSALRARLSEVAIPSTILPHSAYAPENLDWVDRIWAREEYSKAVLKTDLISHDLALYYDFPADIPKPSNRLGVFLREDAEHLPQNGIPDEFFKFLCGDPVEGLARLDFQGYIAKAADYSVVVTDRLHFAIAAHGAGRKTVLLPGIYPKCHEVWSYSLHSLGVLWESVLWANDLFEAADLVRGF